MYRVKNAQGERIRNGLLPKGKTIAVAESVTAGLLQYALSTIPDASKFLQEGITTFNVAQKYKHLRVELLHALSVNCVSGKVAEEMVLFLMKTILLNPERNVIFSQVHRLLHTCKMFQEKDLSDSEFPVTAGRFPIFPARCSAKVKNKIHACSEICTAS